jgi:hypothetical protein
MNKTPSSWAKIDTLDPFDKPTRAELEAFIGVYYNNLPPVDLSKLSIEELEFLFRHEVMVAKLNKKGKYQ